MAFLVSFVNLKKNEPQGEKKKEDKNEPQYKMLNSSYMSYFRPRHSLNSLATAVKEIEEIPAYLPNGAALKDSVQRARDWLQDVEALQVGVRKKCLGMPRWLSG